MLYNMTNTLDFEYAVPQCEYPNTHEATTTQEVVSELVDELDAFLELMMSTLSLSTGSSVEDLQTEINQLEVDDDEVVEVVGRRRRRQRGCRCTRCRSRATWNRRRRQTLTIASTL
jgi:hypothetical protein